MTRRVCSVHKTSSFRFCLILLACSFLLLSFSLRLPPKVVLHVEQTESFEGKPIPLVITVDHMQGDTVKLDSFRLLGQKLTVEKLGTKVIGANFEGPSTTPDQEAFVEERFRTTLSPRKAGIYDIGPIVLSIGGRDFQSNTITINVLEAVVTKDFTVQSTIQAPRVLYPGQKIQVVYQLRFKDEVQLLTEKLPLLDLEGFTPLSSPVVSDRSLGNGLFEERIEREFRAVEPGEFHVDPSSIEGMKYVEQNGAKVLVPPLMISKEAGRTIVVMPFPEKNRPPFFDGALGSFLWRGRILGESTVQEKGYLEVEWRVTGRGDIDTVRLPPIQNDPLFSNRFLFEGEPKETKESESSKVYRVYIRPKRAGIKEIPSFSFASFDPVVKEYIVTMTKPLLLEVKEGGERQEETLFVQKYSRLLPYDPVLAKNISSDWPFCLEEVYGIYLGFCLIGFLEKRFFDTKRKKGKPLNSRELYYKAYVKRRQPLVGGKLLKEALLTRLVEVGLIDSKEVRVEELSDRGVVGEVKGVVRAIDEYLFDKVHKEPFDAIWKEAVMVYHTMKSMKEVH